MFYGHLELSALFSLYFSFSGCFVTIRGTTHAVVYTEAQLFLLSENECSSL